MNKLELAKAIVNTLKTSEGVNTAVNANDYSFVETDSNINNSIIFLGLGGSYAYGTYLDGSDIDVRGIAMHSKRDQILSTGFDQVVDVKTDTTIYSLDKIVMLLANSNPNTIEILGVKPEHVIYADDIGRELLKRKEMFLSKRCVNSFMGYANQQLYRLQQKSLVAMSEEEFNAHICRTLYFMTEELKNKYNMDGISFHLDSNKHIVLDLDLKDYSVEDLSNVLGVLNKTIRDYHKNSKRNEKALAHDKIAKHAMHLLRLYMMCEDILLNGEINTYRVKEHDLLMSIRNGDYLGYDGKPISAFYDIVNEYNARVAEAAKKSYLPDNPDQQKIDDFLVWAYETVFDRT